MQWSSRVESVFDCTVQGVGEFVVLLIFSREVRLENAKFLSPAIPRVTALMAIGNGTDLVKVLSVFTPVGVAVTP